MKIIDLHCDTLLRLFQSKGKLNFDDAPELDVNYERMIAGGIYVQAFAIFVPPDIKSNEQFQVVLDQIHYFYTAILGKHSTLKLIKEWTAIDDLKAGEIGVILTLEGVDAIGNDIQKLSILYQLGVRLIGLTWNHVNLAADGILEKRGAGLTTFGREIVQFNNEHKILTDVSHLSETAFWDVLKEADYPIASHSNAKAICPNPRNLSDEQASAMFAKDGCIHLVYYPPFVKQKGKAHLTDLLRHIEHFCTLGGSDKIGLGSDFDGINQKVTDLENASKQPNLINELLRFYSEDQVKGFAYQNFLRHRPK